MVAVMNSRWWMGIVGGLCVVVLVACGGGSSGGDGQASNDNESPNGSAGSVSTTGVSQKGPFREGGTANAVKLASDGTQTDQQVTGTIADRGEYELAGIDWTGPTEIRMEGVFFDEVAANFSTDERVLNAVTDVAEDASLDANVNIYTHFAAARVRFLMAAGEPFGAARDTARNDLQQAVGISSAPEELNLLETLDGLTDDSANLLLFSAAVQKGAIGQNGLDELAGDFADDGEFNGDGADEFQTIVDEGTDDLLSDARIALQNQYSTEPPDGSSGGGSDFGWTLSACAAAKLTGPRVFCSGEDYEGTKGSDEDEPILFFPEKSGYYAFSMAGSELSSFASWTLEQGGTEVGDASSRVGDTTDFSLRADDRYRFDLDLFGLSTADDSFTLFEDRVSDGRAFDPVELEVGTAYAARVGFKFENGSNSNGAATSWYRLDGASGSHRIRTSGYVADPGPGGLRIAVYEGNEGQQTVNDIGSLPRIALANGSGSSSNELTVDLAAGKPHFILITNLFTDFRRETAGEATGTVEFDLEIAEN